MSKIYDVVVIGAGPAGLLASYRINEKYPNANVCLVELGRPIGKRRRFLEGGAGCFPTSDGKLYTSDLDKVSNIVDGRKIKPINKWISEFLLNFNKNKVTKNKNPTKQVLANIKNAGYTFEKYDYVQWEPVHIHSLSKYIAEKLENNKNIDFSFDNEVLDISKSKNIFNIETTIGGEIKAKKIILCVGRSSWRWVNEIYRKLGILRSDDIARFGIRVEMSAQYLKEYNSCHCSFYNENITVGPLSWNGTVIQEDHANFTTAAFRSNERRWNSDKVSFSIIGDIHFKNKGCEETSRLAQLSFLLGQERVGKEKLKALMNGTSQLSMIPQYSWLPDVIEKLEDVFPKIKSRSYFHYPAINTITSKINLGSNLESEVEGLFIAGESAGVTGILAAMLMGGVAAESSMKDLK